MTKKTDNPKDYNQYILQALNSLRTADSDALVLYWENRLGVAHGTIPSDGVKVKRDQNNSLTLEEILDDVFYVAGNWRP